MDRQTSDSAVRRVSPHHVPHYEKSDNYLLHVILTNLSDDEREKLVQHYQTAKIKLKTWTPSKAFLQTIARQGPHRDSHANLYALAIVAYRAGWSSLLVADELTKRQLTGNCRVGEDTVISLVILSVLPKTSGVFEEHEVCVAAIRTEEKDKEEGLLEKLKCLHAPGLDQDLKDREPRLDLETGMILHDPDRRVFEPDTAAVLARERWFSAVQKALPGRLPQEMVSNIIEHVDSDDTVKLSVSEANDPRNLEARRVVFLLLFPTTQSELLQTQSIIQAAVNKFFEENQEEWTTNMPKEVDVLPLHHHGIKTRRDLMIFWEYHNDSERYWELPPIQFVFNPIRDGDIATAHFGMACADRLGPTVIFQGSFDNIASQPIFGRRSFLRALGTYNVEGTLKIKSAESMYHPEQPFWFNPPLWMSADRLGWSYRATPMFYLTQHLTEDQKKAIETELTTKEKEQHSWRNEVCYVPWTLNRDATEEDIWWIFWEYYRSRGMGDGCLPFFCIDQQSGEDQTVLLVTPDWYPYERERGTRTSDQTALKGIACPMVRGICYSRLPGSEAHFSRINPRTWSRVGAERDGLDVVKRFRRPGWPAPGNLLREDETDTGEMDLFYRFGFGNSEEPDS